MKYAHTRSILQSLAVIAFLAIAPISPATPKLMQGPMVGAVSGDNAKIWARVAGNHAFVIRYSQTPSFTEFIDTPPQIATAENDYCVEVELTGLEPGSFYYYQVLLDGQQLGSPREREGYPLLTAPPETSDVEFTIAFGSGAKSDQDALQAIWLQVQNARPHTFFWLGENEGFSELDPVFQAEEYRKQRSVPFLQPLLRSIPQLATWEAPSGSQSHSQKLESLEIFDRYWANPSSGNGNHPGTYFKHRYGRVDFFVLDTYTYRDTQDGNALLGSDQLDWLKNELSQSNAQFKVILSGRSWTNEFSETKNWLAYQQERAGLFSHIQEQDIPGVVLLSGTNEHAEVKAIPLSSNGGYDLYELSSSPLAQDPDYQSFGESEQSISIRDPYAESMNFGFITFDMSGVDPKLTFEVINVFGDSIFPSFELRASELRNGIVSWKAKVDPDTIALADGKPAGAL